MISPFIVLILGVLMMVRVCCFDFPWWPKYQKVGRMFHLRWSSVREPWQPYCSGT